MEHSGLRRKKGKTPMKPQAMDSPRNSVITSQGVQTMINTPPKHESIEDPFKSKQSKNPFAKKDKLSRASIAEGSSIQQSTSPKDIDPQSRNAKLEMSAKLTERKRRRKMYIMNGQEHPTLPMSYGAQPICFFGKETWLLSLPAFQEILDLKASGKIKDPKDLITYDPERTLKRKKIFTNKAIYLDAFLKSDFAKAKPGYDIVRRIPHSEIRSCLNVWKFYRRGRKIYKRHGIPSQDDLVVVLSFLGIDHSTIAKIMAGLPSRYHKNRHVLAAHTWRPNTEDKEIMPNLPVPKNKTCMAVPDLIPTSPTSWYKASEARKARKGKTVVVLDSEDEVMEESRDIMSMLWDKLTSSEKDIREGKAS